MNKPAERRDQRPSQRFLQDVRQQSGFPSVERGHVCYGASCNSTSSSAGPRKRQCGVFTVQRCIEED